MMDCSGFTKTVLLMNGIVLLRDASQQAKTGTEIDISAGYDNLKKGDLMFFGKNGRIRHVAIYLGNEEFIHASGYVRISSLDPAKPNYDEHNTKEFVKASRITGAVGTRGITPLSNIINNL
jgi:cell wall-associated NlpC family hydrolase